MRFGHGVPAIYARHSLAGSLVAALAFGCGPARREPARPAAPSVAVTSAPPSAPVISPEVTRAPLGACELAEELPIAFGRYREAGAALERAAPEDSLTCEASAPAAQPSAKLFRLTTDVAVRFWATGGPYPDLSGLFPPVVIRVHRGCPGEPGSRVVACGDTVAEDLTEGKYFVTVAQTADDAGLAAKPPTGALAYRISSLGDTTCPHDLALRRLDDWMGEAVPQLRELGDVNGDSRSDVAVEHRAASNQAATRLLVADDYPRCLRTVLDADVTLKVDGGTTGGWKNLATTAWAASPASIIEDMWVVRRAAFDPKLGRYVEGKRLGCSDGPSPDARRVPCREPRSGP